MARWPFRSKPDEKGEKSESDTTNPELEGQNGDRPPRWALGILNDKQTDEVPGLLFPSPQIISIPQVNSR